MALSSASKIRSPVLGAADSDTMEDSLTSVALRSPPRAWCNARRRIGLEMVMIPRRLHLALLSASIGDENIRIF